MDENGTQTWTLYDGSDPIMDFSSGGSLEMRYLNGPTGDLVDTVIARESAGGTIAWYLPDRLGTIRDLISNSGSIIDHVDYSAFGTVLDESSPTNGDRMMGFAGMERDTVTGLNLAVNRVQNPGTGRWKSQDPLGFAAGDDDLYRYVGNSPTYAVDPKGLQEKVPDPGVGAKGPEGGGGVDKYGNPPRQPQPPPKIPGYKGEPYMPGRGAKSYPKLKRKELKSQRWVYYWWDEACPGWKKEGGTGGKNVPRNRWYKDKNGRWLWVTDPDSPPFEPPPTEPPPPRVRGNTYVPPPPSPPPANDQNARVSA